MGKSYMVLGDEGFVGPNGLTCNPAEALRFEGDNGYANAQDEADRWCNAEVEPCED